MKKSATSTTKSIEEMLRDADTVAAGGSVEEPGEITEPQPEAVVAVSTTPPGLVRVRILSGNHTDGRLKKTWLQNSVIEIDQYTAERMIARGWAAPTQAAINEILVEYKGK